MKQPDYRKTDRLYGFSGELGAIYSAGRTEFRVWSPLAHEACVLLYRCADSPGPFAQISMERAEEYGTQPLTETSTERFIPTISTIAKQ